MHSEQRSPCHDINFCEDLNKIWYSGWLDSFSEDYFLIRAMRDQFTEFAAY